MRKKDVLVPHKLLHSFLHESHEVFHTLLHRKHDRFNANRLLLHVLCVYLVSFMLDAEGD